MPENLGGGRGSPEPKAERKAKAVLSRLLSVGQVFEARKSALRHGLWFRALNRLERGAVDLTIKYVDDIKSTKLAKMLMAILEKLQLAAESVVDRMVRSFGFVQARKISLFALGWGNVGALVWAEDRGFARYLAVMHLNASGFLRI
jgi:hypothetical protein